jgi:hypothetical protein
MDQMLSDKTPAPSFVNTWNRGLLFSFLYPETGIRPTKCNEIIYIFSFEHEAVNSNALYWQIDCSGSLTCSMVKYSESEYVDFPGYQMHQIFHKIGWLLPGYYELILLYTFLN